MKCKKCGQKLGDEITIKQISFGIFFVVLFTAGMIIADLLKAWLA